MMGNVLLFLIRPGIIDLGAFCVELWFRQQKNFGPNAIYFVLETSIEKQQMRIQEDPFLKIALNLDLTLSDDGECPTVFDSLRNY